MRCSQCPSLAIYEPRVVLVPDRAIFVDVREHTSAGQAFELLKANCSMGADENGQLYVHYPSLAQEKGTTNTGVNRQTSIRFGSTQYVHNSLICVSVYLSTVLLY